MKTASIALLVAVATVWNVDASLAQGRTPEGLNPNHYECYSVRQQQGIRSRNVKLINQFGATGAAPGRAIAICVPTQKNTEEIKDKDTHFVCFAIEGRAVNKRVAVTNQF